jgi:hypothetical protein
MRSLEHPLPRKFRLSKCMLELITLRRAFNSNPNPRDHLKSFRDIGMLSFLPSDASLLPQLDALELNATYLHIRVLVYSPICPQVLIKILRAAIPTTSHVP